MTETDLCVNKPHKSRSYFNHLVCVGVLVILVCLLVFTVFCIVCTVFLYCFVNVYLFLFVTSVRTTATE